MHGCDYDLKLLVSDFGIVTVNLFDTAQVFSFIQRITDAKAILKDKRLQTSKHVNLFSLENLVKLFLDVKLDKLFQVADWRIRPLPEGMIDYARCDSHYLIPIYLMMIKMLTNEEFCYPQDIIDNSKEFKNNYLQNLQEIRNLEDS